MSVIPVLSIVIPTYNSSKTLSISLDSVASQFFRDFEVVIIDGASTDDTVRIAESYISRLPSVTIISEPDKGIYDAMNKSLALAKGTWIYFLGSDDSFVGPTVLGDIFQHHKNLVETSDFIYGNVFWGTSSAIYMGRFDEYMIYRSNICHQAIFMKKSVLIHIGGFDLKYPALADWKVNMRCFMDKKIKKDYLPHMIAYFAIDGSSKDFTDHFKQDKEEFYKSLLTKHPLSEQVMKEKILFEKGVLMQLWLTVKYKLLHSFGI